MSTTMFLTSRKHSLRLLFVCLIFQIEAHNDRNSNVLVNSSEFLSESLNISDLSEDLKNLSDSLVKLRDMFLEELDPYTSSSSDLPNRKSFLEEAKEFIFSGRNDREEEASSKIYKKAKFILKSSSMRKKDDAYKLFKEASSLGNNDAKGEMAWASLFGVNIAQDFDSAVEMFEELSFDGHPDGHAGLGILHGVGLALAKSEDRSLLHLTIAAIGGSTWARMALGNKYWFGLSVAPDCQKASQFYRLVAETVVQEYKPHHFGKNNILSVFDEPDKRILDKSVMVSHIRDYYTHLAENGEVTAQVSLGHMYYYGATGLGRDTEKALYYYKLADRKGTIEAAAFIGKVYLEGGENTEVNPKEAFNYFKKAAINDNAIGEAGLGMMYLKGIYVKQDYSLAFHYLSQSAQKGYMEGAVQLGKMYLDGLGVERDYGLARKHFTSASVMGHVVGSYYLGIIHEHGYGTFRSCFTATELYKSVAERGSWDDLFNDAYSSYISRKYKESLAIYLLLAELGYAAGQVSAATLLDKYSVDMPFVEQGATEPKPKEWVAYRKALLYWNRASRQGNGRSLLKIGDHFFYGMGIDVDYEGAFLYYRLAALKHNEAEAMFNLGYMHEHGVGLPKDAHLARRCYDTASDMSEDAWLPVSLAVLKLSVVESLSSVRYIEWGLFVIIKLLFNLFTEYWDIAIIIILGIIWMQLILQRF